MKRILSLALCVLMLALTVSTLASCTKEQGSASFVSVEINPAIELTVDAESKVVSVYAANEDASVLLYEQTGIVGADVEDAIEKITALAIELGYLDESNQVVGTTVSSEDGTWAQTLQEKINTRITATAKDAGLTVKTDMEGAYSLLRQLEAFKAKYPDNTAVQQLSVSKFKLALSASENGEMTLESAVELDDKALIELVSTTHKQIEVFATEVYAKAKQQAFALYDELAGIAVDGVYGEFYVKNLLAHPTTCWYGHTYQMYKTTARGFDAIADALVFVDNTKNYKLSDAEAATVMNALGLAADERALIEDGEGNVTLESVYAYADKTLKNTAAAAEAEAMKAELDAALDQIETVATAEIRALVAEHRDEIEAAVATAEEAMNYVLALLPETAKTALEAQNAEYDRAVAELLTAFETGEASQAKMRECANTMERLAEEMLTKIKADLSESELAEVEESIQSRESVLNGYRATMEQTIAAAEQTVKEQLAKLRAERAAA